MAHTYKAFQKTNPICFLSLVPFGGMIRRKDNTELIVISTGRVFLCEAQFLSYRE